MVICMTPPDESMSSEPKQSRLGQLAINYYYFFFKVQNVVLALIYNREQWVLVS